MMRSLRSLLRLPVWRIGELLFGAVRAKLRLRQNWLSGMPVLHKHVQLRANRGRILVGHLSELHRRVAITVVGPAAGPPAEVRIGSRTSIWYGTVISARRRVEIGSHCAISWNCTILDDDMHVLDDGSLASPGSGEEEDSVTIIEDRVWMGAGATVLKGVRIGAGSVVAAGAVVTRDVPSGVLVAGAPAKIVRQIKGWT